MAGIFPDSSSIRPWIPGRCVYFFRGSSWGPISSSAAGHFPSHLPPVLSETFLLLRRSLALVTQVGPWASKHPRAGGPRLGPGGFLELTLCFFSAHFPKGWYELGLQKCQCKEEIKSRRMETQELRELNSVLKNTDLLLSDQMFFHLCTATAV